MLVLSRKPGERIYIGTDICVTVLEMKRHAVRLGIEAPVNVGVMREELVALVQSECSPEPSPELD